MQYPITIPKIGQNEGLLVAVFEIRNLDLEPTYDLQIEKSCFVRPPEDIRRRGGGGGGVLKSLHRLKGIWAHIFS